MERMEDWMRRSGCFKYCMIEWGKVKERQDEVGVPGVIDPIKI